MRCVDGHEVRNKIQSGAGALLGEKDDISYIVSGRADDNHRVPNVNANSNGDWNWNLGNFENVWNDNNAFLCFCNLYHFFSLPVYLASLSRLGGRSFICQIFLPTSKHTPNFIQKKDRIRILLMT